MRKKVLVLSLIALFSVLSMMVFAQPIVQTAVSQTQIFFEPNAGETPFVNAINSAKHSVKIEVYVMTARDIFDAIQQAVARGVNVQVILTQHPYNMEAQAQYAYKKLSSIGANVRWAPSRFTYDHAKFMIIDDSFAIFGTSNLTWSGISQNVEANIETKDPQFVKSLEMVFKADWTNTKAGSVPREYLVLSPGSEKDLVWLINHAKKFLSIVEEEVPEASVFKALKNAALRGVKVRLIEPAANAKYASGLYPLAELAVAGVKVGLLKTPWVHAKMIISDNDYLFIGSENVSYTSMYDNREVGAILSTPSLVSKATEHFNLLWANVSVLPAKLPTSVTAFLTNIVGEPYQYMGKLVKTIGTVEAAFGPIVFISSSYGNEIAGLELWLGHVMSSTPKLEVGQVVRVVGSVDTYKGQLEISAIIPPKVISKTLLPLPFEPNLKDLRYYDGLKVLVKGDIRIGGNGIYLEGKSGQVNLLTLGKISKIPNYTGVYVEGIVVNVNGNYGIAATNYYSQSSYIPILKKSQIKAKPSIKDMRTGLKFYYNQTVTSTGIVSAVLSAETAYIYSNGYGIRIYGQHGKIKAGDIVEVKGTLSSYNNSLEVDVSSVKIIGHATLVSPVSIKTSELSKYPEVLVKVIGKVSKAKKNAFFVNDGSGPAYVYVSNGKIPKDGQTVEVVGISVRYKAGIYEIVPISIEIK